MTHTIHRALCALLFSLFCIQPLTNVFAEPATQEQAAEVDDFDSFFDEPEPVPMTRMERFKAWLDDLIFTSKIAARAVKLKARKWYRRNQSTLKNVAVGSALGATAFGSGFGIGWYMGQPVVVKTSHTKGSSKK